MNGVTFAKGQLDQAFGILKLAADGMTDEQYNHNPGGTCNSPAISHVHAVSAVDFFILGTVAGGEMIWPSIAEASGLPANAQEIWSFDRPISLDKIKAYSAQVQKAAGDYIGTLSDDDLDRKLTTPFGEQTVAFMIQIMSVHLGGHTGDLASAKGMQGLKGLPF